MLPLIQPDDLLHFQPIKPNQLQLNDIIIFRQNRKLIAHRLIYRNSTHFFTQGDNLPYTDPPHSYSHLVGKVIALTRQGKRLPISYLYLQQATLYLHQLHQLTHLFNQHSLNYLFLKGLPLHLYYHQSPPQRLYLDCDLLLNPSQLSQAKSLLHQLGFKPYNPSSFATPPFHQPLEVSFLKPTDTFPIILDLHLAPVFLPKQLATPQYLYPVSLLANYTQHLLGHKTIVKLKNHSYPLISPQDSIVYLALHFFHHNLQGIHRLQLLPPILNHYHPTSSQWTSLAQLANQFQLGDFIYPSLKIFSQYYRYPIPPSFWSHLQLNHPRQTHQLTQTNPLSISSHRLINGLKLIHHSYQLSPQPVSTKLRLLLSPKNYLNFVYLLLHRLFRQPLIVYKKLKYRS